jgi:prepilin-type N-terminal cleavage/methylation domain-containing protein
MKKNNKKGFTLAELLIVVAIIAVLVLIAIPVFTASLNKSKAAADEANCPLLYAELTGRLSFKRLDNCCCDRLLVRQRKLQQL